MNGFSYNLFIGNNPPQNIQFVASYNAIKNLSGAIVAGPSAGGVTNQALDGAFVVGRRRLVVHPRRLWAVGIEASNDPRPSIQQLYVLPHLQKNKY